MSVGYTEEDEEDEGYLEGGMLVRRGKERRLGDIPAWMGVNRMGSEVGGQCKVDGPRLCREPPSDRMCIYRQVN